MTRKKKNTFDTIVVGSGISGGWAAKELTEGGLVLERGPSVEHIKITQQRLIVLGTLNIEPHLTQKELQERPIQSSHCNAGQTLL
jgi:choline dehydrogenase-like flavoprotein